MHRVSDWKTPIKTIVILKHSIAFAHFYLFCPKVPPQPVSRMGGWMDGSKTHFKDYHHSQKILVKTVGWAGR